MKNPHDGKLEAMTQREDCDFTAHVEIFDSNPYTSLISISGGYITGQDQIYLDPQQAISLCHWLIQQTSALRQLAKYEYRKLADFVEGDTLYLHDEHRITEIKRESGYVALCWLDHGVPQSQTGREDEIYLAVKREEVQG